MCSRTIMKQQIMRQMVMDEEKPHKENSNSTTVNYNNNNNNNTSYRGSYNNIPQNDESLPSLTSTIVGSDKHYDYCKPFIDCQSILNFNPDQMNNIGDEFSISSVDYNDQSGKIDSPYVLHNRFSIDKKYNIHSFNTDYSQQSSNIDNNLDSISYNSQYHNLSSKSGPLSQIHDIYGYETSFSCPVNGDPSIAQCNQRRMSNSNSAMIGSISLNEDKKSQLKDRSKKESHNRIERKRRDFINQQIGELSNLLPSQMMTEGESKKNKGNILKNSVLYIQHLQNEANNTSNYIKESELAFRLVDSYRKQIQELQQKLKLVVSHNDSSSPDSQIVNENFNQYMMLHDQNRRTYQTDSQLLFSLNNNLSTETNNRFSMASYNKSPLSTLDNGSPFKVEPSSAHSSLGNHSLSTYRIDEEVDVKFNFQKDMKSPQIISQPTNPSHPSTRSDSLYSSNSHYLGFIRHNYETMEC